MDQLELLKIWREIIVALQKKYSDINAAFSDLDSNNSGEIEIDDLTTELKRNHNIQSDETIKQLFEYSTLIEDFLKQDIENEQLLIYILQSYFKIPIHTNFGENKS